VGGNLKVIYGPFESLEPSFCERIRELKPGPGEPPLLVIFPSRAMADRLERVLTIDHGMSLAGVFFHTFHSFAQAVVDEDGGPGGDIVSDPLFHDSVVDQVLDASTVLGIAKELRPRALASAVRSSLRDLIDAGVDPTQLADNFGDDLLIESSERDRLIGLLSLLSAYNRKLAQIGVLSPSVLIQKAARAASHSSWLSRFKEIIYYGFYDVNFQQFAILVFVSN
jgi:hypothetical protein